MAQLPEPHPESYDAFQLPAVDLVHETRPTPEPEIVHPEHPGPWSRWEWSKKATGVLSLTASQSAVLTHVAMRDGIAGGYCQRVHPKRYQYRPGGLFLAIRSTKSSPSPSFDGTPNL